MGSSRYAQRLRDDIRRAAADPEERPVLNSGEPGLEKDNIAALIHFGSRRRNRLLLRFNGALLRPDGSDLFGPPSGDGSGSLLACLEDGSLLIDQVDLVDPALLPALLELARSGGWSPGRRSRRRRAPPAPVQRPGVLHRRDRGARVERLGCQIRVPPLRVRRQDLGEWLRFGVRERPASSAGSGRRRCRRWW